jgi:hypothetical protein
MGWNDMKVPSRAPMSETRLSNTGMALAITYATRATPDVQLSQVLQWIMVLAVRCLEPRKMRRKMYFPGSYGIVSGCKKYGNLSVEVFTWMTIVVVTIKPGRAKPYDTFFTRTPAEPSAGEATYEPQ